MLINNVDSELMQSKYYNGQLAECYQNNPDSTFDSQYMLVIGNENCTQNTMIFAYFEYSTDLLYFYNLLA